MEIHKHHIWDCLIIYQYKFNFTHHPFFVVFCSKDKSSFNSYIVNDLGKEEIYGIYTDIIPLEKDIQKEFEKLKRSIKIKEVLA